MGLSCHLFLRTLLKAVGEDILLAIVVLLPLFTWQTVRHGWRMLGTDLRRGQLAEGAFWKEN